jgi:sugar/nucleoside kinase (ribokinase family)
MARKDIDVVAAGHICVDITPAFGQVSGKTVAEILRPGKLLVVGAPTISTGGPVSNTGLALRRLGLKVSLMGKCGDDPFGEMLLDVLRREAPGCESGMSVSPGEKTSYTIAIVLPGIDRIFLHCPGANDTFGSGDIDTSVVRRARLFHFGYPPLMKRMYSGSGNELAKILQGAKDAGAITSLDMALPDPDSEAGRTDWRTILSKALPHTDIFLPSLEELLFMLQRKRFDELTGGASSIADGFTPADVRSLADECLKMGAEIVVLKCGHVGAYLRTARPLKRLAGLVKNAAAWQDVELFEPTCKVTNIVSTTGSGDSSIAGFLAAFLRDEPPARCMATLTVVGAQNLSALDAVSGVRSWDETLKQLAAGPAKNAVPDRLKPLLH